MPEHEKEREREKGATGGLVENLISLPSARFNVHCRLMQLYKIGITRDDERLSFPICPFYDSRING